MSIRLAGMDRSRNLFFVKSWALNRFIYSFRFFCRLIPSNYLKRYVIKLMSQLLSAVSLAARSSSLLLCILGCHAKFEKKTRKHLWKDLVLLHSLLLQNSPTLLTFFCNGSLKNLRKTSFSPYIASDVIAVPWY